MEPWCGLNLRKDFCPGGRARVLVESPAGANGSETAPMGPGQFLNRGWPGEAVRKRAGQPRPAGIRRPCRPSQLSAANHFRKFKGGATVGKGGDVGGGCSTRSGLACTAGATGMRRNSRHRTIGIARRNVSSVSNPWGSFGRRSPPPQKNSQKKKPTVGSMPSITANPGELIQFMWPPSL